MVYFITGNKNKFEEARIVIRDLVQLDIDLPEIQETNSRKIIEAKLKEAFNHKKGEFIVEDVSLCLDCLNGLPGPLIKWFLKEIGNEGIYKIAEKFGNYKAEGKVILGYAKSEKDIHFFESTIKGKIVFPKKKTEFGWDPIFQAEGSEKSFAEMRKENPEFITMRKIAFGKLKYFLENEKAK